MKGFLPVLLGLVLVAAACGDPADDVATTAPPQTTAPTTETTPPPTTQPSTTAPTTPPTTEPPFDPDQRILEIRTEGGLVPPEFFLGTFPRFTLFADGRLVHLGATIAIFPGPFLPAVVQSDIEAEGLAGVMVAIEELGLADITELRNNDAISVVADAPDTTATYFDDNGEHVFSVYALEIADHRDEKVLQLLELVRWLDQLTATSPDAGPFEIERLQVIARVQEVRSGSPEENIAPWPLAIAPEDMPVFFQQLRCAVVDVADDPGALDSFREANQATIFEDGDTLYRLTVRPLLGGETGCHPRN